MVSVIGASIGSAATTYIVVAITGYLSFGDNVAGNIVGMCMFNLVPVLLFTSRLLTAHRCANRIFNDWESCYRYSRHLFVPITGSSLQSFYCCCPEMETG